MNKTAGIVVAGGLILVVIYLWLTGKIQAATGTMPNQPGVPGNAQGASIAGGVAAIENSLKTFLGIASGSSDSASIYDAQPNPNTPLYVPGQGWVSGTGLGTSGITAAQAGALGGATAQQLDAGGAGGLATVESPGTYANQVSDFSSVFGTSGSLDNVSGVTGSLDLGDFVNSSGEIIS